MKNLFLLIVFMMASSAFGATCTTTTRNNYVTNQVLTSTALNADFNQLVTKANDFDGGCVTAGTLESDALNASQFAPLLKTAKEGCFASRSDANTISVDKCLIAVNSTLLDKTSATTVTWGCSGCSSEANSTSYYVYAVATSPLTLQILTTAPDADGYNGTSRVLARFYNSASGDIDPLSVDNWIVNRFVPKETGWVDFTPTGSWTTNTTYAGKYRRSGDSIDLDYYIVTAGAPSSGTLYVNMPTIGGSALLINSSKISLQSNNSTFLSNGNIRDQGTTNYGPVYASWDSTSRMIVQSGASINLVTPTAPMTWANTDTLTLKVFGVPVVGWFE